MKYDQWKGIILSMVLLIGEVGSFQWVLDLSVFQGGFHMVFTTCFQEGTLTEQMCGVLASQYQPIGH